MPTNRQPLRRPQQAGFPPDDYCLSELLSGNPPLLAGAGYYDPSAPGERVINKRNFVLMQRIWREHKDELLQIWQSGWRLKSEFCDWTEPTSRIGSPPGYFKYVAGSHTMGEAV